MKIYTVIYMFNGTSKWAAVRGTSNRHARSVFLEKASACPGLSYGNNVQILDVTCSTVLTVS